MTAIGHGQPVVVKGGRWPSGPSWAPAAASTADTSTLTVPSEDVVPKLQAQAETAVRLLGYTPSANAYNAPQTLTLAELKYQSPKDGVYVTQADITATFRADVQNSSRRYTGRYGASLNQRFGRRRTGRPTASWSVRCSHAPRPVQGPDHRSDSRPAMSRR